MTNSPFPALHTSANQDAEEHVAEARKLVDETEAWLADLDALLGEPNSLGNFAIGAQDPAKFGR